MFFVTFVNNRNGEGIVKEIETSCLKLTIDKWTDQTKTLSREA